MYVKKCTANKHIVQIDNWSKTYFTNRIEAIRLAKIDYIKFKGK